MVEDRDELEERHDGVDGSSYYYGSREAFERSGLIPDGLAFPGDMPGMKGARWYGLDRRCYSMSKWNRPTGTFRLAVRLSKDQEAQLRTERARATRKAQVAKALAEANTREAEYREQSVRVALIGRHAFAAGLRGLHGWSYEKSVVDAVGELYNQIGELLRTGGLVRDLSERNRLNAQMAALSDDGLQRFLCEVQK